MAAQNLKEEDWGNGDTKLGQNWHKNFQACKRSFGIARNPSLIRTSLLSGCLWWISVYKMSSIFFSHRGICGKS